MVEKEEDMAEKEVGMEEKEDMEEEDMDEKDMKQEAEVKRRRCRGRRGGEDKEEGERGGG